MYHIRIENARAQDGTMVGLNEALEGGDFRDLNAYPIIDYIHRLYVDTNERYYGVFQIA